MPDIPRSAGSSPTADEAAPWWGTFQIPSGQAGRWQIGGLTCWAWRDEHQWFLASLAATSEAEESAAGAASVNAPIEIPSPPAAAEIGSFGFERAPDALLVGAALADRPVVIRPDAPFRLLPGQQATLYVTTPLWVRFQLAADQTLLRDIPTARPSDTWFGPSTREGELCYAERIRARLNLAQLNHPPGRAATAVSLHNTAGDALLVERINLPVTHLALYRDGQGHHWTQSLRVERGKDSAASRVQLVPGVPELNAQLQLVRDPRRESERGGILRAFQSLVS